MRIGILGTGTMAAALAQAWSSCGHTVFIGGRSPANAETIADRLGDRVLSESPKQVAADAGVVVVAVAWEGLDSILALAGAPEGALNGKPVLDCTNAVDYATGMLKPSTGSAAEHVARLAPGAHVVKALHLFAGQSWLSPPPSGELSRTVAMCGDDPAALDAVAQLVRDLGAFPAVIGGLEHARQLEDVAGFVMRLVAQGCNPITALPSVTPSPA